MATKWLKEDPQGVLVASQPDEFVGTIYHIWFPYARDYMKEVKEGAFVVVRSFASEERKPVYSILEIVSVMPTHYALGSSVSDAERSFPGFVVEAARSAKQDWEQATPEEETTKIKAEAIPTGLQLHFEGEKGEKPQLSVDESLPMAGETAHLLTNELIDRIVNGSLSDPAVKAIKPCTMVLNKDINVCISTQDLLRTHFGVFGFTGSGKSNLVSTVVDNLMASELPVKIVLFDLMSEYLPLLIDDLDKFENAYLLSLDSQSIPGGAPTLNYIEKNVELDKAIKAISRTMLLPVQLAPHREKYAAYIKKLLEKKKLKVYDPGAQPLNGAQLAAIAKAQVGGTLGNVKGSIEAWIAERMENHAEKSFTDAEVGRLATELEGYIRSERMPSTFTPQATQGDMGGLQAVRQGVGGETEIKATASSVLRKIVGELKKIKDRASNRPPEAIRMSPNDIFGLLHDSKGPALLIVQCDRDDELREYVGDLVARIFGYRRHEGINQPPVLFAFDEADEFIPQGKGDNDSYATSRAAVATLARRGRKFGMGMSIATQRVAYLDTSIMAQPHTYLVSKLPRKYDRDTMASAFGLTDEMMRKSLKFTKGQWLLVSYDATGLVNVPIPVQFPNANDRILGYISK